MFCRNSNVSPAELPSLFAGRPHEFGNLLICMHYLHKMYDVIKSKKGCYAFCYNLRNLQEIR